MFYCSRLTKVDGKKGRKELKKEKNIKTDHEQMDKALMEVGNGMFFRKAAEKFGVSKPTLNRYKNE